MPKSRHIQTPIQIYINKLVFVYLGLICVCACILQSDLYNKLLRCLCVLIYLAAARVPHLIKSGLKVAPIWQVVHVRRSACSGCVRLGGWCLLFRIPASPGIVRPILRAFMNKLWNWLKIEVGFYRKVQKNCQFP
jgi:hypothetical protein